MKLKKFALRGLTGVLVAVALCMFFSGTIENITTPKVKFVRPSRGKLTEKLELDATLAYPETEEVRLSLPAGQTLTITRVNVRAGYEVDEGDVLFRAGVTGYDAAAKQAQADYDAALDALLEVERKNEGLTLRRSEEEYARAYAALRDATRESASKRTDVDVLLRAEGLEYPEESADVADGGETDYPDGASDELKSAIDAWRDALGAQADAQAGFDRAARYGVSDAAWSYITEKQSAQEKADACAEKLVELEELNRAAAEILAPHDGVIAQVNFKLGDPYDGNTALCTITAEDTAPALRANIEEVERDISEGMDVTLPNGTEAEVSAISFDDNGERCIDVEITKKITRKEGSIYRLSMGTTKLALLFTANQSTNLLPASAVRGSGDSRYVYVINERQTTFGQKKYSISKQDVTVLGEADGMASIEEELSYYDIAYMEDRALTEGSDVMRYEQ